MTILAKISVIIPFYNVEKYIHRCAVSLFEQNMDGIEYVFVNDCSSDRSLNILLDTISSYPKLNQFIKVVNSETNRGSAGSRNVGLKHATGKYIGWVDGDDWVENNMFGRLYETAENNNADVVWSDFFNSYSEKEILVMQDTEATSSSCIQALMMEKMYGVLWNKLVRKDLYEKHEICFPEGLDMWEDLYVTIQHFFFAKHVVHLPEAFYHYVQYNDNALSRGDDTKRLKETIENSEAIMMFLKERDLSRKFMPDFDYLKFAAKQSLLFKSDKNSFVRWRYIYPEANHCALYYKALPLHLRLLAWCASVGLWPMISLWVTLKRIKNV